MADKFDYYDILSTLIPGIIFITWIPVCFPFLQTIASPKYPDAFTTVALIALAVFVGQIILAVSSLIMEPLLYRIWGGRPSEHAFVNGLNNFSQENASRIRAKLADSYGANATDGALFLCAMQIAESAANSRAPKFNSLYAYHRSLSTLIALCVILFLLSIPWGLASSWQLPAVLSALAAQQAVLFIVMKRTRQRANYYVREVLLTAERVLDERAAAKN